MTGSVIDVWIFDLDNTLYPASARVFAAISARIGLYLGQALGLDPPAAQARQRQYVARYGTTLRGMMECHGTDPDHFMDFVHDVDLSVLAPATGLDQALSQLPGRKLIHTNGSVRHAERVLGRLGLARHFEAIFDIAAAGWQPKPDPAGYDRLIAEQRVDPARAAMVEDMAVNLGPAAARGMVTIWVSEDPSHPVPPGVRHRTQDLAGFLADWA